MNRHRWVGAAFVIAAFSVTGFAIYSTIGHAGVGRSTGSAAVETTDQPAPGTAALRAHLDPETGELAIGPTPSSGADLDTDTQNALRRDDEGLVIEHHADGSVSMDLQGRYQSISVVQINQDGTASITCADDAKALEQTLNGQTTAVNAPEVK